MLSTDSSRQNTQKSSYASWSKSPCYLRYRPLKSNHNILRYITRIKLPTGKILLHGFVSALPEFGAASSECRTHIFSVRVQRSIRGPWKFALPQRAFAVFLSLSREQHRSFLSQQRRDLQSYERYFIGTMVNVIICTFHQPHLKKRFFLLKKSRCI